MTLCLSGEKYGQAHCISHSPTGVRRAEALPQFVEVRFSGLSPKGFHVLSRGFNPAKGEAENRRKM